MSSEFTQRQSGEDQRQAQQLSLQKSQPPATVPGYQLERFLGSGAYGEVWVGTDQNTGRQVAVKFYLHSSGVDWSLLSREVEKLVFLSADRYVVQLLDVGWDGEPPYYVMEYVENGSLEDYLKTQPTLGTAEAVEIFREMVIGLMHAHNKGVLHCDLKPANILLDQDHKPRLADFGQSRLSHEQTPALGTLFYMAPEQAHLQAVPDVRWDIYALGAILYRMLTGNPPHRSSHVLQELDTVGGLDKRLAKYRQLINRQTEFPKLSGQAGIDRSLTEILQRCLAPNPDQRFQNVPDLLQALDMRHRNRARRPLLILGILGPMFLLIMMTMFGSYWYNQTMREAQTAVRNRVYKSNAWFAKYAAKAFEVEIARYFKIVEEEADQEALQQQMLRVNQLPGLEEIRNLEKAKPGSADVIQQARDQFSQDLQQGKLHDYLQERLDRRLARLSTDPGAPKFASLFVLNPHGTITAVAYDDKAITSNSVGKNFCFRTYFHGGPKDLAREIRTPEITPIQESHLSAVFQSTTTKIWKVAFSTPIYQPTEDGGKQLVGIMAITVNLGDFASYRNQNQKNTFAVLIDGRPGIEQGTILNHPAFNSGLSQKMGGHEKHFRIKPEQLKNLQLETYQLYQDPIAETPHGKDYRGDWIAAIEPVRLPGSPIDSEATTNPLSELMIVVQENDRVTTEPLLKLGNELLKEGILAICVLSLITGGLWFFVVRTMGKTQAPGERPLEITPPAGDSRPQSHDLTTMAATPDQQPDSRN